MTAHPKPPSPTVYDGKVVVVYFGKIHNSPLPMATDSHLVVSFVSDFAVRERMRSGQFVGRRSSEETSWGFWASEVLEGGQVDMGKWIDPVHVEFANTDFSDIRRAWSFVKKYGTSGLFCGVDRKSKRCFLRPDLLQKYQSDLRGAWRGTKGSLWFHPRSIDVGYADGALRLAIRDLWTLICVGFMLDRSKGTTGVCEYGRCTFQPYFLRSRKDQQFCSKQCRAKRNMEIWRSRPQNVKRERTLRKKRQAEE